MSQKLGEMYVSQAETVDAVQFQGGFIETVSKKILSLEQKDSDKEKRIEELTTELRLTREQLGDIRADVNKNKRELKSNNMIINGFKEQNNENCIEATVNFLKKLVPELKAEHISIAYRVGKKNDDEVNRAMFVKFKEEEMKRKIMKQKGKMYKDRSLGMRNVYCNDDLPEESRLLRHNMREVARYQEARIPGEGIGRQAHR